MNETRYRKAERRLWDSIGLVPSEQRVHLQRSNVTVRIQEVGEGPAVLLIHGASNSGASWAGLVARMDGFRCLMVDRPGAGLSGRLTTAFEDVDSLAAFSDTFVIDVLDALGVKSAHLVATSYGGYAALRGAAAYPDRVGRIVIFGWTMGAANPRLPALMRLAAIPAIGRLLSRIPVNERAVRSMFRQIGLRQALVGGRISQEMITWYVALLRHTDTMRNELEVGRWTMSRQGLHEGIVVPPDLLSRILAPVYFLWGEEDPFGGPDVARDLVRHIPNAELELLPGAGHAVWLDDAEHAAKVTTRFLAES